MLRKLSRSDRQRLTLYLHDCIHDQVEYTVGRIANNLEDNALCYPPGASLKGDEVAILRRLFEDPQTLRLIKILLLDRAGGSVFDFLTLIDGAVEPDGVNYEALSIVQGSIEEAEAVSDGDWHDYFIATYWKYLRDKGLLDN